MCFKCKFIIGKSFEDLEMVLKSWKELIKVLSNVKNWMNLIIDEIFPEEK